MTEQRLFEIMAQHNCFATSTKIKAMKQAVNEALDEAAEKGKLSSVRVDILNLKVK
jgi:hypothetical protein